MANNVYPCFKCGKWFSTKGEQKVHKCGQAPAKPLPVKQVIKEDVEVKETPTEEVTNEEVSSEESTSEEFDRKEAVETLKENGVDGRSLTRKSDEELIEMLKEIEA